HCGVRVPQPRPGGRVRRDQRRRPRGTGEDTIESHRNEGCAMSTGDGGARLEMRHISKSFGGVHALRDVSVSAYAGEVHALCGENGAGKSTLMKILAGAITDYEGEIALDGRPSRFAGPRDAEDAGVRIIYQELNLVTELTVAANIFLGRERTRRLGWLDDRAMEAEARRLVVRPGAAVPPRALTGGLLLADHHRVQSAT